MGRCSDATHKKLIENGATSQMEATDSTSAQPPNQFISAAGVSAALQSH
ncbi:hypothetical protein [Microcoleus sp. F4-D5]